MTCMDANRINADAKRARLARICLRCGGTATVSWPVRNNPHCMPCVADARAFLDRDAQRRESVPPIRVEPERTHVALEVLV